jgi:hypothetical protein
MKHHKTCFYFGKEPPCLDFYVLGGPHIPKIFGWWAHPMAICDIFTLKKLCVHLCWGGGGNFCSLFIFNVFLSCSMICSQ